jgi:benzaldehyde dehydrogenase (NAD)
MNHRQLAPSTLWSGRIYSDGWVEPGLGTEAVLEKATGAELGRIGFASASDVAQAAISSKAAQISWSALPAPQRGDVIRRFSQLVLEHGDEIAEMIVRETGSIRPKGRWEVHMTAREVLEAAALASQPGGVLAATAEVGRQSVARRMPVGVVGIITPWNSPFLLAARAVAPALTMGNAVILKPDPQSPICGGVFFAQLLEEAGLPKGLFHMLPGGAETGNALVREPGVNMISFTGSTKVGRQIGGIAGEMLKRVSLELGGNNPYVVLDDANVEAATSAGAWGSFFHQGQICLSTGRHLVHEKIVDRYIESLAARAKNLVVGDPYIGDVHLGPIVNERQAAGVDRIIKTSLAKGAKLIAGGSRDGLFYQPTVISNVMPGMALFDDEIFGPVAAITTFSDDEQAIALANQTDYGLSAAIVTPDLARAQRMASRLHSGIIHINDQTVLHEVYGPIGGVGVSGNGFNHSTLTNADQFTEWQWVTTRMEVPPYPY